MRFAFSTDLASRPASPMRNLSLAATTLALVTSTFDASAQVKLEANYKVALIGVPLGQAAWVIDVDHDRYTVAASAQLGGLIKVFSAGEGAGASKGLLQGGRLLPQSYAVNIRSKNKVEDVRMTYAGPVVKTISAEPQWDPSPETIPLTEVHKRGTVDPISAGLMPPVGNGEFGPEACQRSLTMFDGRMRFDLVLDYKRTEQSRNAPGYQGPVVVCSVTFKPIAGHEPNRSAIRFLSGSKDIELWLAPIEGTQFVAMYRIVVPTVLGAATLEATRFAVVGKPPMVPRAANGTKASEAKTP
ncbi:MAG: hypothetical protein QOD74_1443 [Variibacter sp.]|nr:hypothetical protein [Variibacter sp.]